MKDPLPMTTLFAAWQGVCQPKEIEACSMTLAFVPIATLLLPRTVTLAVPMARQNAALAGPA